MKIAFLGDIALIGKYDLTKNPSAKLGLSRMAEKLRDFDYVVANLESPLTTKTKTMIPKSMHIRSSPINIELIQCLNINAVSLANNHVCDFGRRGLEETIEVLEKNGIDWFGANGRNLIINIGEEKVSLSGFCCLTTNGTCYLRRKHEVGVNMLTLENVMQQLEKDEIDNAFTVLSMHWGLEHTNYPNYEHIELAHKIAERKDVIIHGHHPHVIQGIQRINNSVVAFSLGNFLFDNCSSINGRYTLTQNPENLRSFIWEVSIEKGGKIIDYDTHGFMDTGGDFCFFDISSELQQISDMLLVDDIDDYNRIRHLQFTNALKGRFGERDLKWLITRLNYHSIGAYLSAFPRKRRYLRESEKFKTTM